MSHEPPDPFLDDLHDQVSERNKELWELKKKYENLFKASRDVADWVSDSCPEVLHDAFLEALRK